MNCLIFCFVFFVMSDAKPWERAGTLSLSVYSLAPESGIAITSMKTLEALNLNHADLGENALMKKLAWLDDSYSKLDPIALADFRKHRPDVSLYEGE